MAASSLISQNKRGRDEYLNSGLDSRDAKRTNSGTILGRDSNFMALLDRTDSVDNNNSNPEDTHTVVDNVEGEMRLNVVINSVEDEIGLNAQTEKNIKSTDEDSSNEEMGSNKQGQLTADGDSEAIPVTFDMGDFPYYDDVCGELGFLLDNFTPDELGILHNHFCGDLGPDIRYLVELHDYVENTEVFYGSLWEDDIWH